MWNRIRPQYGKGMDMGWVRNRDSVDSDRWGNMFLLGPSLPSWLNETKSSARKAIFQFINMVAHCNYEPACVCECVCVWKHKAHVRFFFCFPLLMTVCKPYMHAVEDILQWTDLFAEEMKQSWWSSLRVSIVCPLGDSIVQRTIWSAFIKKAKDTATTPAGLTNALSGQWDWQHVETGREWCRKMDIIFKWFLAVFLPELLLLTFTEIVLINHGYKTHR